MNYRLWPLALAVVAALFAAIPQTFAGAGPAPAAGDINDDGTVNVTDVQCAILLALGADASCAPGTVTDWWRHDLNCDDAVDVVDIVSIIKLALTFDLTGSTPLVCGVTITPTPGYHVWNDAQAIGSEEYAFTEPMEAQRTFSWSFEFADGNPKFLSKIGIANNIEWDPAGTPDEIGVVNHVTARINGNVVDIGYSWKGWLWMYPMEMIQSGSSIELTYTFTYIENGTTTAIPVRPVLYAVEFTDAWGDKAFSNVGDTVNAAAMAKFIDISPSGGGVTLYAGTAHAFENVAQPTNDLLNGSNEVLNFHAFFDGADGQFGGFTVQIAAPPFMDPQSLVQDINLTDDFGNVIPTHIQSVFPMYTGGMSQVFYGVVFDEPVQAEKWMTYSFGVRVELENVLPGDVMSFAIASTCTGGGAQPPSSYEFAADIGNLCGILFNDGSGDNGWVSGVGSVKTYAENILFAAE